MLAVRTSLIDALIEQLAQPPVNMVWHADIDKIVGFTTGLHVFIFPYKVEITTFLWDELSQITIKNAQLMRRILCDLRPEWEAASEWLAHQMWQASTIVGGYAGPCGQHSVMFAWEALHKKATLVIRRA